MDFNIVGGCLRVQKSVFVKEMLCKNSKLRNLLNRRPDAVSTGKLPVISEPDPENFITIDFTGTDRVNIGESPADILKELKMKYTNGIKGKVACKGILYTFDIDLNSDGDNIEFIMD